VAKHDRSTSQEEQPKSEAEILAEIAEIISAANARKDEIEGARQKRANEYLAVLTAYQALAPHPSLNGVEATDDKPFQILVIFGSDGKVSVKAPPSQMSKGAKIEARAGSSDLYALGYQAGDRVHRLVRTDAVAKHGGYSDLDAVISATILDASTMESINAKGEILKGSPTGSGRHAAGAGNPSKLYEPSLDGGLFWFRDKSSYLVRDGERLEIDHETGKVQTH
jgi:hypothetical protein